VYYAMLVLILRSAYAEDVPRIRRRVRASRKMRTGDWVRPHASRRIAAHLGFGSSCARRAAMLLSMRATVRGAFLAKRTQVSFRHPVVPARGTPRQQKRVYARLRRATRRGDPVAGTHGHRQWLWVPALAALGRDDDRLARAKHQPAAVGNERRLRSIVSGLLFTMNAATPTCRAVGARQRQRWQDALCARETP
jgi:hypothetical protein